MLGLMPSSRTRYCQNLEVNILSRSDTMSDGRPWRRKMCWRKRRATSVAVAVVLVAMKWAILVRRSTTTKMASFPTDEAGRPTIKSIEIDSHGRKGTGSGTRKPWGLWRGALARAQVSHVETYRLTN